LTFTSKASIQPLPDGVQALKAMAHPARLRMLAMLSTGELCVSQLTAVLELAASTVSSHLKDLRTAGLVTERKVGKWIHYRLADNPGTTSVLHRALTLPAADHRTSTDAAVVRRLRSVPIERLGRGGVDLAAITRSVRACRSATTPTRQRTGSRPRAR